MELLSAKALAIFLALATTAFCVSTIVLAVQKADLEDELQEVKDKLDELSTTTVGPSTNTPSTIPTPSPPSTVDPPDPSNPTEPTPTPDPGTPSTPPTDPTAPTPSVPTPPTQPPTDPTVPTAPTPSVPTPSTPLPTLTTPSGNPVFPTLPPGLTDPELIRYRLPHDIRPIKYNIYYHPHMAEGTFDADVSIQIEIDVATNLIPMHAKNIEVDSISILNMMGRMRVRVKRSYFIEAYDLLIIELEELLYTNTPYVVTISYRGKLNGLYGMYATHYLSEEGEKR